MALPDTPEQDWFGQQGDPSGGAPVSPSPYAPQGGLPPYNDWDPAVRDAYRRAGVSPPGQVPVSTTMPVPDPNQPGGAPGGVLSGGGWGSANDPADIFRFGTRNPDGSWTLNGRTYASPEDYARQVRGGAPGGGAPGGGQPVTQEQVLALFQGQPVTPETLKRLQPQLNAMGVHLQNEARGDLRPRLLLPNGETVDLGAWGGPPQWQPRGNIGDWHNAGGAGGGGGGGSAGMQAALETSPGYQFRLAEGLKGVERGAAAKGTLLTGGTLKALTRYGQDFASNEYQNRYNQLYGLSQLGLNAAGQSGNLGSAYAGQAGNILGGQAQTGTGLITGGANAGAAGTVGAANATQQGLQNAMNAAQQAYWMWLMQQSQRPPVT